MQRNQCVRCVFVCTVDAEGEVRQKRILHAQWHRFVSAAPCWVEEEAICKNRNLREKKNLKLLPVLEWFLQDLRIDVSAIVAILWRRKYGGNDFFSAIGWLAQACRWQVRVSGHHQQRSSSTMALFPTYFVSAFYLIAKALLSLACNRCLVVVGNYSTHQTAHSCLCCLQEWSCIIQLPYSSAHSLIILQLSYKCKYVHKFNNNNNADEDDDDSNDNYYFQEMS